MRFWDGPWVILNKLSDVTFRIKRKNTGKEKVVHHNRLKLLESHGPKDKETLGKPEKPVRPTDKLDKTDKRTPKRTEQPPE